MNMREVLKDFSRFSILEDYQMEIGDNCDYKKLLIAPSMIQDKDTFVLLNHDVAKDYQLLVESSNMVLQSLEYPFMILGSQKEIDGESIIVLEKFVFCSDTSTTLSSKRVAIDEQKLFGAICNEQYDVMVWGRVHGTHSQEITDSFSQEYREKYNIRDDGRNVSLGELDEYMAICEVVSSMHFPKDVYQITIMSTGEVAMIGVEDGTYRKFKNIHFEQEEKLQRIAVDTFDSKFTKGKEINKRGM